MKSNSILNINTDLLGNKKASRMHTFDQLKIELMNVSKSIYDNMTDKFYEDDAFNDYRERIQRGIDGNNKIFRKWIIEGRISNNDMKIIIESVALEIPEDLLNIM